MARMARLCALCALTEAGASSSFFQHAPRPTFSTAPVASAPLPIAYPAPQPARPAGSLGGALQWYHSVGVGVGVGLAASLGLRSSRGHAKMSAQPARRTEAPRLEPLADRRSVLNAGALCLAPGIFSPELAAAEGEAVFQFFPEAKMSAAVDDCVGKALEARGFNTSNTLFAHSVCSDEVNYAPKELIELMRGRWGESFTLGGLAGVPFAGKAGLNAYAHHVPDEGKLFVMFAPHVGVGGDGKVGALERAGIAKTSSACGAAVGAFKVLSKAGATTPDNMTDVEDLEFDYIKKKLKPKLAGVENAKDDITFVTYQMYSMVRDAILEQIYASPAIWDDCSELALLGGVQINRFKGGDMFQPLMFQTVTKSGKNTDLYADTFGHTIPQITPVVGNGGIAESVLKGALRIDKKALVDRKVRPKLENVEEKLKKVREDISRLENGYGGDLDTIAEELSDLQDNMKFDELTKDMKILAG